MNPVFIFLVIICAAVAWLLLSFTFRFIGGIVMHFAKKAEEAMSDEPSKKDMFIAGFKNAFKAQKKQEGFKNAFKEQEKREGFENTFKTEEKSNE